MEDTQVDINAAKLAALRWYLDAGVDEVMGDLPVNRFEEIVATEKAPPAASAPHPASQSANVAPSATRLTPPDRARFEAEERASACSTLEELKQAIESFDGCILKKTAANTVFSDGNPESGLMFVGEAPGAEEDRQGKPFVGASGQLLDRMLAAIGRDRQSAYIANILPWRPPGNRKPSPQETAICLPFIQQHIKLAKPRVLVFLGGTSASTLLDTSQGITRLRGKWTTYSWAASASTDAAADHNRSVPALPTYHPAYLLRQPQLKGDAWRDFLSIQARLDPSSGV